MTLIDSKVLITGLACMHPIGKDLLICSEFLRQYTSNRNKGDWYNNDFGEPPIGRIPDDYFGHKLTPTETRSLNRISRIVSDTVAMCLSNACIDNQPDLLATTGIISGSAFGCLESQDHLRMVLNEKGPAYFDPVEFPWTSHNFPISAAAIKFGLKGPITAMIASMSAGLNAIIYSAFQIIKGQAQRMIVVAFDEINELQYAYLKEKNYLDCVTQADKNHSADAVYLAESCVAWMLESEQAAKQRKAPIYGQLDKWHLSFSGFSGTDSDSLYQGIMEVISKMESTHSENIKFVTNGSGYSQDDHTENLMLKKLEQQGFLFQDYIRLKPIIGNCLGAASLFEGALLLEDEYFKNANPKVAVTKPCQSYLFNSFGMGGNQIALTIQTSASANKITN